MTPIEQMKIVAAQENLIFRKRFGKTAPVQGGKSSPAIQARRKIVAQMDEQGITRAEICKRLNATSGQIDKDLMAVRRARR